MTRDPVDVALEWDGLPPLAPLWEALARRMGASERPVRRIKVSGLGEPGRRKIASLLGFPRVPTEPVLTLDIDKLGAALGLDPAQLRRLVERVRGPIENRAAERAATTQARAALWARAQARLGARVPLTLARIRGAGVPDGDVAAHQRMLDLLADGVDLLPASPPLPLPMLAWCVSGDPHALDPGTPAGRYLQLASAELAGVLDVGREPEGVAIRRALLDLGVVADRMSSPTLTFGLRASPESHAGRLLEAGAAYRAPVHLCAALLDLGAPELTQQTWLCVENPSVVEAAVLAGHPGPLVCTSGWPSLDTQRVLDLAREQGIALRYAGDYDPAGLAIAQFMASRYGATIAMTARLYLAADHERAPAWTCAAPDTPWDPELASAIADKRRIVYQEDPAVWRALLGGG